MKTFLTMMPRNRESRKPAVMAQTDVDGGSIPSGIDGRGSEIATPLWANDFDGFRVFFQTARYFFFGNITKKVRLLFWGELVIGHCVDIPHDGIQVFVRRRADTVNIRSGYIKPDGYRTAGGLDDTRFGKGGAGQPYRIALR